MDLREATREILGSDSPAAWLRLADGYIHAYNKMPEAFILPKDHALLRPVIEVFHDKLPDFAAYCRAVRDHLGGDAYHNAHELYRTISTRSVQQNRRARLYKALDSVEAAVPRKLAPDERARGAVKLEKHWGLRRREMLAAHRRTTPSGRLSTDHRAALLEKFWHEIDKEIETRDIPLFNF